jgi:hypothetical protein
MVGDRAVSETISGGDFDYVPVNTPPIPSTLQGVPAATLQIWLGQAQTALGQLMSGQATVEVQYSQGQGHRMVRYKTTDVTKLKTWIAELNAAMGSGVQRRMAMRFGM